MILVIDDPVSSFDFENKVGIMSLLKSKVAEISYDDSILQQMGDKDYIE